MDPDPDPQAATLALDEARTLADAGDLAAAERRWSALADRTSGTDRAAALAEAARLRLLLGRPAAAREALEQARHLAQENPPVAALVHACLARAYLPRGAAKTAVSLLQGALPALADAHRGRALVDLAEAHVALGETASALAMLREAMALDEPAVSREAALVACELAIAAGQTARAVRRAKGVARQAREAGAKVHEAKATTLLGRALVDAHAYPAAKVAHEAALDAHTACGHRPGIAASLGGLGLCRLGRERPAEAAPLLTRAIAACAELEDLPAEAAWRAHLDHTLRLLSRTEWRCRELARWIEVTRMLEDEAGEASLWCELGLARLEVRDLAGAEAAHASALAISTRRGDDRAMSIDHANLGHVHLVAQDLDAAREAFTHALALGPDDAPHLVQVREAMAAL